MDRIKTARLKTLFQQEQADFSYKGPGKKHSQLYKTYSLLQYSILLLLHCESSPPTSLGQMSVAVCQEHSDWPMSPGLEALFQRFLDFVPR